MGDRKKKTFRNAILCDVFFNAHAKVKYIFCAFIEINEIVQISVLPTFDLLAKV